MTKPINHINKSSSDPPLSNNLYKNIDVSFFESIVSGILRPFLPQYDSPDELYKLNTVTFDGTLTDEQLKKWCFNNTLPKEVLEKFDVTDGDIVSINISEDKKSLIIKLSKPEDFLEPLIDIDIPPPPDDKAETFLNLIEREFDIMKRKAQKVLDASTSDKHLTLYANKNIQLLKDIAPRAETLYKKLDSNNKSFLEDPNLYIIFILKEFLIRAIRFYQELFNPFLNQKTEDYYYLRTFLYGEIHPVILSKRIIKECKFLIFENIQEIYNYINESILQIELYLSGKKRETEQYNLSGAFSKLFIEILKPANFTNDNINLLSKYYQILETIENNIIHGNYSDKINTEENFFNKIEPDITKIQDSIISFLDERNLISEPNEEQHSVIDIMLNKNNKSNDQNFNIIDSSNMNSIYHPSIENFLILAKPKDKLNSNWSCHGFYDDLSIHLLELEANFGIYILNYSDTARKQYIDSHLKHIDLVSVGFKGPRGNNVEFYLKQYNLNFEDIFEGKILDDDLSHTDLPNCLSYTYKELYEQGVVHDILNLQFDFILYISDYFVKKLKSFLNNLLIPNTNNPKPTSLVEINNLREIKSKKEITDKKAKVQSFEFIGDANALLNFFNALQVHLNNNFVKDLKANTQSLCDILIADSIQADSQKIHFSCQTTQLAYIFFKLNTLFSNLSYSSIGLSELFYSNKNNLLTENNLTKSKSSCNNNPLQKNIIDREFQAYFGK